MSFAFHGRSATKRGGTGGHRRIHRDKVRCEIGGPFTASKVSEGQMAKIVRGRGANTKVKLLHAAFANVLTPKGPKKSRIKRVLESPDNRHYARMNVVTKGAIIETELGKALVLNRVGQDGVVHARLVS